MMQAYPFHKYNCNQPLVTIQQPVDRWGSNKPWWNCQCQDAGPHQIVQQSLRKLQLGRVQDGACAVKTSLVAGGHNSDTILASCQLQIGFQAYGILSLDAGMSHSWPAVG
jgi:hypothetical protein